MSRMAIVIVVAAALLACGRVDAENTAHADSTSDATADSLVITSDGWGDAAETDSWMPTPDDPYPDFRRVDGGACDAEAPDGRYIVGNHCCGGGACYGDCVVAKSAASELSRCWCFGVEGGCKGLECCSLKGGCIDVTQCAKPK